VNCAFNNLKKQIKIKIVPIITCKPCKPVKAKKADPYTLSEKLKGASKYSPICNAVNKIANNNVTINPVTALL
jgi:hypothetical protein